MDIYQKYLEYISNQNERITVEDFLKKWKPTGEKILNELVSNKLITVDENNTIHLTDIGKVAKTI
ncbi:hypothetical protein [Nitrosomonas ureae]|uniref:ArnR1-like winged helix-turn-helix domain-containing protein n=1 Tax=Nitrosomonas ureae TaxID=44577 RepID=A0A2T5ISW6_9PROT|nr:hypothetical protein [Nitrosomonas ureae]PTQ86929.1 hypothetical protein C8R28_1008124 [Nitrosomonas ureae]